MKKGISYWSLEGGLEGTLPIDEAIQIASQQGFEAFELCIGEAGALSVETSESECEAIQSLVESSGMAVETLASGMSWAFNPLSNDADVRNRSIELHKLALQRAAWIGCEAMLFVPGVVCSPIAPNEKVRYDRAVQRAREAINQLLDTAEEAGVDLCIENVWNGLFYSPLELRDFIDSFASKHLAVYFDIGNVLGYQQYPPHWIELLAERIKRVHIKDYREEFGWQGKYEFCDLSKGDVPLLESIRALQSIGYDRTLIAEMLPWREGLLKETRQALDLLLMKETDNELAMPTGS